MNIKLFRLSKEHSHNINIVFIDDINDVVITCECSKCN